MSGTTNEAIREYAESIDPDSLPREEQYLIIADRPMSEIEPVAGPIDGKYHAQYIRDKIEEEKGYAGVTFRVIRHTG